MVKSGSSRPSSTRANRPRSSSLVAASALAHDRTGGVGVEGDDDIGLAAGFNWMDVSSEGPAGGWTGHVYALWGRPVQNFLVLSGTGANDGWHDIASGTDTLPDGDFDWIGTLYEGELPPYGPLEPSE